MFENHPYYWLLASLPALPAPAVGVVLPINARRLASRLRALPARDAVVVDRYQAWLALLRAGNAADDAEVQALATTLERQRLQVLDALVALRSNELATLASLRGIGQAPRHGAPPASRAPWLAAARAALSPQGDPAALQQALDAAAWRELSRLGGAHRFNLPALLVYLARWELLDRACARDAQNATRRFEAWLNTLAACHVARLV